MPHDRSATLHVIAWEGDQFGILIEFGNGHWLKYLVGSRNEAEKELARIVFDERRCRASNIVVARSHA
jgi:hypothetical protein